MLRRSFHGWRIKQEIQNLTAIRTPSSPRLNSVRDSPTPLPPLFSSWQWQKNLPPTSHFRFTRQTTRSIPTGFSATAYCSRAPEPGGFTRVEDPNPNVDSLRESSVGVDDGREDDGEGLGRRRTLPEQLSSTVVVLTCMSVIGTCNVFLLRQGLSGDRIPVVSCDEPKNPYLQLWWLDGDYFESLMRNSKVHLTKSFYPSPWGACFFTNLFSQNCMGGFSVSLPKQKILVTHTSIDELVDDDSFKLVA
ncbi:uncharacterized protein LOC115746805 isoform X3 [Rhodamnia argentea]|uniref:Uncharacterized protein LOC115746805 isoform X3 n=1 Tax=Rhodamnia argentea TaxID=178133 RepID=A0ABM3HNA7_9MYRT|nr:uncharacterized protein LOC115746805 isoform X3 [Rhodamnia argentea]